MAIKWIEIESGCLDMLDVLRMLAEGKNIDEVQIIEPALDEKLLRQLFSDIELFIQLHIEFDKLLFIQRMFILKSHYANGEKSDNLSKDDTKEIERLVDNDFSVDKIAQLFSRETNELKHIVKNIKKKGDKNG